MLSVDFVIFSYCLIYGHAMCGKLARKMSSVALNRAWALTTESIRCRFKRPEPEPETEIFATRDTTFSVYCQMRRFLSTAVIDGRRCSTFTLYGARDKRCLLSVDCCVALERNAVDWGVGWGGVGWWRGDCCANHR